MSASPVKVKAGRVTVERDPKVIAAAAAVAGRRVLEITWPPLMARVHHPALGTDHPEHAGDGVGLPGTPTGDAWVVELAREYASELVVYAPYLVKHLVENGASLKALAAALERVAKETGADVLLVDQTTPRAAPMPAPDLPPVGAALTDAPAWIRGEVREVLPAEQPGLPDLLNRLGRDATTILATQDRLIAQRGNTSHDMEHRTHREERPAAVWLRDVIRSHEPRLLLIEHAAKERADLGLDALATEHRVAVAVVPAPARPTAYVTPESMLKEARNA